MRLLLVGNFALMEVDAYWKGIRLCECMQLCRLCATMHVRAWFVYLLFCWYYESTLPLKGSRQTVCFTWKISRTPWADPCKPSGFSRHAPTVYGQLLAHGSLVTFWLLGTAPTAYRYILVHGSLVNVWLARCSLTVYIYLHIVEYPV